MIKMLIMDVDGTMTDGQLYYSADGDFMKGFYSKDGYAITQILPLIHITPAIITGRESEIVAKRAADLKIEIVYQNQQNKIEALQEICEQHHLSYDEIAYIGDDLNDLECIETVGISACPSDAVLEIKEKVSYVCSLAGGRGAVREFCDYLAKMHGGFTQL